MSEIRSEVRAEATRLVLGLLLVAVLAVGVLVGNAQGVTIPIGYTLLATLGVALVGGPVTTGIVSVATCAVALLSYAIVPVDYWMLRFGSIVGICALATAGSALRRRRERALLEQNAQLAIAQDYELVSRMTQHMLERAPMLTQAGDIPGVARQSVRIGRELFDASACSYWQVDGDECVLVARDPDGLWPPGQRLPVADMVAAGTGARTAYTRRRDLPAGDPRAIVMDKGGTAAGTSTSINVDGSTVAFLALSWSSDEHPKSPAWFDLLDRYADQVALAKTVVRRRAAQEQASTLGRRLQRALLPNPIEVAGAVETRTLYRPGTRDLLLGGDFLAMTYRESSDGHLAFLLGDVSGHGPEAAAVAVSLRSAWSAMVAFPQLQHADWVCGLEHVLHDADPGGELFVTVVMGLIDPGTRYLSYVTAGHPPPVLLGGDGPTPGPEDGPPLGVLDEVKLEVFTLDLRERSGVLLVTDGIFEGHDGSGVPSRVGYDEFMQMAARTPGLAEPDYLDRLANAMSLRNGGPLDDDVTALLMLVPSR